MEVILIKDVPGLGFQDEKVIVKDGYGRNYLIPQGLCVLANKSNSKILEEKLKQTVKKQEEVLKTAQKIAKKIGDLVLEIKLKSGSEDKVFGSVTTSHIAKMLDEKGFEIDKRNITLSSKVNSTGEYTIFIKLHKDITHEIDPDRIRPIDADLQIPDIKKFKSMTTWKPEISFEQTMSDLLEYWRVRVRKSGNCFLQR